MMSSSSLYPLPSNVLDVCRLFFVVVCSSSASKPPRPIIFDDVDSSIICHEALRYHSTLPLGSAINLDHDAEDSRTSSTYPVINVQLNSSHFTRRQAIKVSVSSSSTYVGLLLQARWLQDKGNRTVGRFFASGPSVSQEVSAKSVSCDEQDDTLVRWFQRPVMRQEFSWVASADTELDSVQFVAIVFLDTTMVLQNVTFAQYLKGFTTIDVSTCGKFKGCFRYTSNGESSCDAGSCEYLLTYRVNGTEAHFEMTARATGWTAVGFSSDDKMGGDDVFVCVRTLQHEVQVRRYIIELRHQTPTPVGHSPFYGSETELSSDGGRLSCRFSRPVKVMYDQTSVDLSAPWYQLYAWGPNSLGDNIMNHYLEKPPTSRTKITLRLSRNEILRGSVTIQTPCCAEVSVAAVMTVWIMFYGAQFY